MGRRRQKARKRSRVLRTNSGWGVMSERESTWEVRTKSETFFAVKLNKK